MKIKIFKIKCIQIIRIGVGILATALILSHVPNFSHGFTAFFMGMGCGLSLVGAGKCFIDLRRS